jgi:hypothetical protein
MKVHALGRRDGLSSTVFAIHESVRVVFVGARASGSAFSESRQATGIIQMALAVLKEFEAGESRCNDLNGN